MTVNPVERFYEVISSSYRSPGIHVSTILYDCLRRGYYEQIFHPHQFNTRQQSVKFWIGRQLHETPVLAEHEVPLEWEGIHGTADEYEDGVLVDKKTTEKEIPRRPSEQYTRQVEYYKVMLEAIGKPVTRASILYIQISPPYRVEELQVPTRDSEVVRQEMRAKLAILNLAFKRNQPPERKPGWLCDYCSFASVCWKSFEAEYHADRWAKALEISHKGKFDQVTVDAGVISATYKGEENEYACFIDFSGEHMCTCKDQEVNKVWCKHLLALLIETRGQIGTHVYTQLIYGRDARRPEK